MSVGRDQTEHHISAADYVTGRMTAAERQAAESHLATCVYCRAAVDAIQEMEGSPTNQNTRALFGYMADLLVSTVTLLAPVVNQLSPPPPPPAEPQEFVIEIPFMEPLRVLRPRIARGIARPVGRLAIVLALTIGTLFLPTPTGLTEEGHRALALFAFTASILALEPVPLAIAALLVPVAQVALGIGATDEAFVTFSDPVVFLVLASLFLAEALRKHGLTRRVALMTVVASGGGARRLVLGVMAIAAGFSMWVENTATAAVLIPVALTISRQIPDPKKAQKFLILLVLAIAYAASIGGMTTIMGSSANAVASGYLSQVQTWRFIDWFKYGLPAFMLVFPLTYWVLMRLSPPELESIDIEPSRKDLNKKGAMNSTERELMWTMIVTAFLWVFGSGLGSLLGLPPSFLSSTNVAILAVGYLSLRTLIGWDDVKGVSWGVFLIIGAGLSLGAALTRTGVTDWFATLLEPLVGGLPMVVILLLLVYLSALLTNVLNNTTITAVLVPILISLAAADPNLNAVALVMPVTLATTFGYSLPSASGRMSLVSATGIVGRGEMLRYGLILTLVSSGALALFFYVLTVLGLI